MDDHDTNRIHTLKAGAKIIYEDIQNERDRIRKNVYEEGDFDAFRNERLSRVLRHDSTNCHNFMKTICGKELRLHNRGIELTEYLIDYLRHCSNFDTITDGRESFTTAGSRLEEIQLRMKTRHGDLQPYREEDVVNFYLTTLKEQQELLDADSFIIDNMEAWELTEESTEVLEPLRDESEYLELEAIRKLIDERISKMEPYYNGLPEMKSSFSSLLDLYSEINSMMDHMSLKVLHEMEKSGSSELQCFDEALPINDVEYLVDEIEKNVEERLRTAERYYYIQQTVAPFRVESRDKGIEDMTERIKLQSNDKVPSNLPSHNIKGLKGSDVVKLKPSSCTVSWNENDVIDTQYSNINIIEQSHKYENHERAKQKKKLVKGKLAAFKAGLDMKRATYGDADSQPLHQMQRPYYLLFNPM